MKIWIDVTDLETWAGHLTGTQRVTYAIARRYADSKHDARYFVFRPTTGQFFAIDFEPIRERMDAAQITLASGDEEAASGRSLKQRIKALPKALVRRVPLSVRQQIPAPAKQGLRKLYRVGMSIARTTYSKLPRPNEAIAETLPLADFGSGDTVLILGKPWDFPTFMTALGALKQERQFKLVTLIHDLIPTFEPHLFGPGLFEPFTKTLFEVANVSDGLLAVSRSTKKDISRFCKELLIPEPPVAVVRLGDDVTAKSVDTATVVSPDPRVVPGEYLLSVGTIELRKNVALIYMAYREAVLRGIDLPRMVVVGRPGWLTGDALYQMSNDPAVKDKFVVLQGMNDQQLRWLYENCRYTVFPSVYEGWGLPIAESLGYGKLCIASRTSSMTEMAGDLLEYHSPYNAGELLDLMVKYLDDTVLRNKEKQIASTYKQHSWDHTYAQSDEFVQKLWTAPVIPQRRK